MYTCSTKGLYFCVHLQKFLLKTNHQVCNLVTSHCERYKKNLVHKISSLTAVDIHIKPDEIVIRIFSQRGGWTQLGQDFNTSRLHVLNINNRLYLLISQMSAVYNKNV